MAVFQQDFKLKVSKVEAIRFARKFWILGRVLFPRGKRKTLYTTHMYVYIYIRTYSSNMSASTCIHVQQKPVFLLHQLGKELPRKHQPTPCILSFHDKNRNSPEQDTVGSIATHTKGGKESSQNEPGALPATYPGGEGVPAVVKLCISRTFHENLVKFSHSSPCFEFLF